MESFNKKISQARKPRVHITYDVEGAGSQKKVELPFVVGVMGDYSGHNKDKLKPLKQRQFVEIDGENFNDVMTKMQPALSLKVDNKLEDDDSQLAVDLSFNSMDDFEPGKIAEQVPALKHLLDKRSQLLELLNKADRSDELEAILEDILQDGSKLDQFIKKSEDNSGEKDNG